jgi:hypothetical protein
MESKARSEGIACDGEGKKRLINGLAWSQT